MVQQIDKMDEGIVSVLERTGDESNIPENTGVVQNKIIKITDCYMCPMRMVIETIDKNVHLCGFPKENGWEVKDEKDKQTMHELCPLRKYSLTLEKGE